MSHNDRWEKNAGFQDYSSNQEKRINQKNPNKNNFYKKSQNSVNDRTMISD